jgi:hypothetical protein
VKLDNSAVRGDLAGRDRNVLEEKAESKRNIEHQRTHQLTEAFLELPERP